MPTFQHRLAIMGLLSFLFGGCGRQPGAPNAVSPEAPVLKVAVFADGRITVDGTASTVPALRESLQTLNQQHGVVWYYREAGEQEPPPVAADVIQAVIDARLPIRLSSRPDDSDSIGVDGKSTSK